MIIVKNTIVEVNHCRKGIFMAMAEQDFNLEDEWYPLKIVQSEAIIGLRTVWKEGESIPCRNSLCKIKIIEEV
jgi:hypothetical protein